MTEAGVYLSGALTAFVALILLGAAWHKAQSFLETTGFVAGYELVPPGREAVVLRLLIAAEAGAVVLLVLPWTRAAGGLLAAALFAGYGAAMALALRAGKDRIECGCGGAPQIVSRPVILRNLLLAAVALAVALLPEGPMGPAAAAVALAAGLTLWCVYGIVERLLANAGHMRLAARS
ncbi:MauE/DoxX family redox-associated membrane protein [Haematobacter genomosp. 1]|uniref:Methylamine utilization protein MauE n=1 Tax=Haematobacter genomosp. 1 TaxID=366618 RepID=A0A212AAR8_9RHOB|nr:MauE/DoxX family redox-associated membrane protein [Haematobacter genomosp. 1]OWJ77301.1 hypothetical protein CDV49_11770 [Haematobacter genomosp. 1]